MHEKMEGSNDIILKRPRREIITLQILTQNTYVLDQLQLYYKHLARNSTPINWDDLVSGVIKLWKMIQFEYKEAKDKKKKEEKETQYNIINTKINNLKSNCKTNNIDNLEEVHDEIQCFLLETGVNAFVNSKDYDPMDPYAEDNAKGLG